jgi:hypothetical protein
MNIRLKATKYIWTAYTLTMLVVFGSAAANGDPLSIGHVVIAVAAALMAFLSSSTVWSWGNVSSAEMQSVEEEMGKRKNNARLENLIARLSDTERDILRERLMADPVHYDVGDDGELVSYR